MKQRSTYWRRLFIVPIGLLLLVSLSGCFQEYHILCTLPAEGDVQMQLRVVIEREAIERLPGSEIISPKSSSKFPSSEQSPETKLAAKVRQLVKDSSPLFAIAEIKAKIETLDIQPETVHITTSFTFPDLSTFVQHSPRLWMLDVPLSMRLDTDQKDRLRLRLYPDQSSEAKQRQAQMLEMLASMQPQFSYTVVGPGKIISSSLPDIQENTTTLHIDTWTMNTVGQLQKILREFEVVTEPGAMDLTTLPLESKQFAKALHQKPKEEEWLPLQKAEPGYIAEGIRVTTTRIYDFPQAEKELDNATLAFFPTTAEECSVKGRLFTPPHRQFLQLKTLQVIEAIDNHNRPVAVMEGKVQFTQNLDTEKRTDSAEFEIDFVLPPVDTRAIEKVRMEAIVVSFTHWQIHHVKLTQESIENAIDLSNLLPNTTLQITKKTTEGQRVELQLHLLGPQEIKNLNFEPHAPGRRLYSRTTDRRNGTTDHHQTLDLNVRYLINSDTNESNQEQPTLMIRYPQEIRRERVLFELEGLDFY